MEFVVKSFLAHQTDIWTIEGLIDRMLDFLDESGLIKIEGDEFRATMFGSRTSDLYIDPLSAVILKGAIERSGSIKADEVSILHACCSTPDIYRLFLRKSDEDTIPALAEAHSASFLIEMPEPDSPGIDDFLSALKTAMLLKRWMDEVPENDIVREFDVGPGDIRGRVESAEWMLYSMKELARLFGSPLTGQLNPLLARMKYGTREELVELTALRNIGRKRARTLYDAGFTTVQKILEADFRELDALPGIGAQLAAALKEQARRIR
jgi:helicase